MDERCGDLRHLGRQLDRENRPFTVVAAIESAKIIFAAV